MAKGYRGNVEGGGGGGPTMVAVRLVAEARRRGSAAGRAGLDPRWAVVGGGGKKMAGSKASSGWVDGTGADQAAGAFGDRRGGGGGELQQEGRRPVLDQNLYYMGANLTSAGFASALINDLPAVTFVMALILRMERVRLRSTHSQAKILGTALTVDGAVLMILYHGPVVQFPWTKGQHHDAAGAAAGQAAGSGFLAGTLYVIAACVAWSGFFVLQSNTLQSYPVELSLTALICPLLEVGATWQ
ncbi:WAT1-related protein [Panicum miliaceum]|uniref:WAT1-related protein n=1 Tax=Panicum miliaceum TaxID=4540 RepID=A0A3L6Q4C1_PANMI|nr:WAT1-related protein [Panicum miliaceum]